MNLKVDLSRSDDGLSKNNYVIITISVSNMTSCDLWGHHYHVMPDFKIFMNGKKLNFDHEKLISRFRMIPIQFNKGAEIFGITDELEPESEIVLVHRQLNQS